MPKKDKDKETKRQDKIEEKKKGEKKWKKN